MASTAAEQVVAAPFTSRPVDSHSSCGVLVQAVNHATGQNTWRVMAADYDYNQEVARAAFADMLHDSERNALYRAGLQAAIRAKRQAGEEVDTLLHHHNRLYCSIRCTCWTSGRGRGCWP